MGVDVRAVDLVVFEPASQTRLATVGEAVHHDIISLPDGHVL